MRFQTSKPAINAAINEAKRGTTSRGMPSLSCIRVVSRFGKDDEMGIVTLTGFNMDLGISVIIAASVEEEGVALVDAAIFSEVIGSLDNAGAVLLETVGPHLVVRWGKKNTSKLAVSEDEYPHIPTMENAYGNIARLDAASFVDTARRIVICAAKDDSRPTLKGLGFSVKNGLLVLSGADGQIAAQESLEAPQLPDATIPASLVKEIAELAKTRMDRDEASVIEVGFTQNSNQAVFRCGSAEVVGSVIDAKYPDLGQNMRIADKDTTSMTMPLARLKSAISRAAVLTESSVHPVRMLVDSGGITLRAGSQNGDCYEEVEGEFVGTRIDIGINPKLLNQILASLPQGDIQLGFANTYSPIMLRHNLLDHWTGLIMPMHLKES